MNIEGELSAFNNLAIQTKQAAGDILWIEFKVRYLAERSKEIVDKLKDITVKEWKKDYWNCRLDCLLDAIEIVFDAKLTSKEKEGLRTYQKVRNKYLHGNFAEALEKLGLPTGGRTIGSDGERIPLKPSEIGDSLKMIHTHDGMKAIRDLTNSVEVILDKLLREK